MRYAATCVLSLYFATANADIDTSRLRALSDRNSPSAPVSALPETDPPAPAARAEPTAPVAATPVTVAVDTPVPGGDADAAFARAVEHDAAKEYAQALEWYRRAAELGHVEARTNLALMVAAGQVETADGREAAALLEQAAAAGNPLAQYSLGLMYYQGDLIARDYEQALRWYEMAAEAGYTGAMNNLGIMYGLGQGVDRDDAHAYAWFALAGLLGDQDGATNRDLTSESLNATELKRGQQIFFEIRERIIGS